jgi:hypothetical protein
LNPIRGQYGAPVKSPFSFSGGFGELRRNHFHTGLDFRTGGQIGLPVQAVKDGSVTRISVSPNGYGHALYLSHPDGHTTVYGHLSRFNPKIEEYVLKQQYLQKQFAVDLSVPPGLFSFQRGEIIAWSGNTGSSGGPHLHFEIRDTQSEKPLNPIFYLPGIMDKSSPRIISLYLYPLSDISSVNKTSQKQRIETLAVNQNNRLKSKEPIEVFGKIGIGIQADDDFNGVGLKCGIFLAELYLDQKQIFSFKLNQLAFDQGRFVNSHMDYEESVRNNRWIHRLFLQPGNNMEIYQTNPERGILNLTDGKIHTVKIAVADAFNNYNTLTFKLVSKNYTPVASKTTYTKQFYFNKPNNFETEDLKIKLPDGTLYDDLKFNYHSDIRKGFNYSKVHQIHNQYVPVHKSYSLSIRTSAIPPKYQSKALIALVSPGGKLSSVGGEFASGWLTANPRVFGDFVVALDTIPPMIRPMNLKGSKIALKGNKIEFKISDNLSGIESYEGEIDGNWALFEFDAKTGMLSYTVDRKRLIPNTNHKLRLTVRDERKNSSEYKTSFYL